jgi:hypothetical protein
VCARCGLDLSLHSAVDVAHWIDDPTVERAGMPAIHDAAAPALLELAG